MTLRIASRYCLTDWVEWLWLCYWLQRPGREAAHFPTHTHTLHYPLCGCPVSFCPMDGSTACICCCSQLITCVHTVGHPRCVFINYIWLNQLSNTTNLWLIDVYYLVINYMFRRLWPSSVWWINKNTHKQLHLAFHSFHYHYLEDSNQKITRRSRHGDGKSRKLIQYIIIR